jgi:hypothetical protein
MKAYVLLVSVILINGLIWANQLPDGSIYPEVGKKIPSFVLHDIEYYSKKAVTQEDLNG